MEDNDDVEKSLVLNGHTLTDKQHQALVMAIENLRDATGMGGEVVSDTYRQKACELIALIHSPGKKGKESVFTELCSVLGFFALLAYVATLIANR
jgi:hypothetical protein